MLALAEWLGNKYPKTLSFMLLVALLTTVGLAILGSFGDGSGNNSDAQAVGTVNQEILERLDKLEKEVGFYKAELKQAKSDLRVSSRMVEMYTNDNEKLKVMVAALKAENQELKTQVAIMKEREEINKSILFGDVDSDNATVPLGDKT